MMIYFNPTSGTINRQVKISMQQRLNTKNYYAIWKAFNTFYLKLNKKPGNWEDRLMLFVGYLINKKCKSRAIRSYICAIKSVLHDVNVTVHEDTYLLGSLIKACRLKNDQIIHKLPIHCAMIQLIVSECIEYYEDLGQHYLSMLYAAVFCSAYFGLLRIGEIAIGSHPILAINTHTGVNKKKILFVLTTSKTHGKNKKPQVIKISVTMSKQRQMQNRKQSLCPFTHISNYVLIRHSCKSKDEPFFVFHDDSPIPAQELRKVLSVILRRLKFNPSLYSFHGFRAGRATNLLKMGFSVETIKKIGRWKSNAVYNYLH